MLNLVLVQAAALPQRKRDVLAHAQRVEERPVLENHGHPFANGPHALFAEAVRLFALDTDGPGIRLQKTHQHTQGHRLAHAAAAQNAEGLAAIYKKAHVLQN